MDKFRQLRDGPSGYRRLHESIIPRPMDSLACFMVSNNISQHDAPHPIHKHIDQIRILYDLNISMKFWQGDSRTIPFDGIASLNSGKYHLTIHFGRNFGRPTDPSTKLTRITYPYAPSVSPNSSIVFTIPCRIMEARSEISRRHRSRPPGTLFRSFRGRSRFSALRTEEKSNK